MGSLSPWQCATVPAQRQLYSCSTEHPRHKCSQNSAEMISGLQGF